MFEKRKYRNAKVKLKETKIALLVENMLSSGAVKEIDPYTSDCFIMDKEKSINLWIDENGVKVANHQYLYEVALPLKSLEKLKAKVKESMYQDIEKLKKKLFNNEVELLNNINKMYTKKDKK